MTMNVSFNHILSLESSDKLIADKNIQEWRTQRPIDMSHVDNIIKQEQAYHKKRGCYLYPSTIVLIKYGDIKYIGDGQHRLKSFEKGGIKTLVPVSTITVESLSEVDEIIKIINSNKEYVQVKNDEVKRITKYFMDTYPKYVSKNHKFQRPNFNPNTLTEKLNEYSSINYNEFMKRAHELNEYIKNNLSRFGYMSSKKIEKNGVTQYFYLGALKNLLWVEAVMSSTKIEEINFALYPYTNKRVKIPQAIRRKLWDGEFGDKIIGKCYIGGCPLHFSTFECGHIIPHSKGGSIELSNLKVVCKQCNNDMGTQNLIAYKKLYEKSKG